MIETLNNLTMIEADSLEASIEEKKATCDFIPAILMIDLHTSAYSSQSLYNVKQHNFPAYLWVISDIYQSFCSSVLVYLWIIYEKLLSNGVITKLLTMDDTCLLF